VSTAQVPKQGLNLHRESAFCVAPVAQVSRHFRVAHCTGRYRELSFPENFISFSETTHRRGDNYAR